MRGAAAIRGLARWPIFVAPMAGGPTTPALVVAAADAGAVAFLAAGYKTPEAMRAELATVRQTTGRPFGINLFVPGVPTAEPVRVAAYARSLEPLANDLRTRLGEAGWDDDGWAAKLHILLEAPPPIVSFTFGCPPPDVVSSLRAADALVAITVTTPEEAVVAAAAGADCLCVQGFEAGAHRGSFANDDRPGQDFGLLSLIGEVRRCTDVPMLAAGGIASPEDVAAVLAAGAVGVQAGTAFLRCPESGASPVHKAALVDPRFSTTAITRAFSGRRARGLVNRFLVEHPDAPAAYPEINNLTRRLRGAASAAGDADHTSLYAGQGFRAALDLPAGEIVELLAGRS